MKNNLADLNNHLFSMLEELENEEIIDDPTKFNSTLRKASAMCQVSSKILDVAKVQVSAIKTADICGLLNKDMPELIAIKDSPTEKYARQKLLGGAK